MRRAAFLGTDLRDPDVVPYFTWDAPLTVRDIHERLRSAPEPERFRLLGKILANKLCTLLSRSELRDLVDVYALEQAGFRVEDALPLAEKKDGGLTPAQLAWVLSQIDLTSLPPGRIILYEGYGPPPEETPSDAAATRTPSRCELLAFLDDLCKRLVGRAMPTR